MTPALCAQYFAFGIVLGYSCRWLWACVEMIFKVPTVVIGGGN